MNSIERRYFGLMAVVLAGIIAFAFLAAYVGAHFEAAAYERVTGKKVSAWDAMFLDLRVQEPTK